MVNDATVLLTVDDGIATIALNRPKQLNAFTSEMLARLDEAVDAVNDDRELFGAIVTGVGRGFCSGRDLSELRQIGLNERSRALPPAGGLESSMISRIEVPTVAAVNGPAVGGGLGFVVQCDFVICSSDARLKDGHLETGVVPSVAAWYIPRRIGAWGAMAFFAEKTATSAEVARELGLADEVVAPESLMAAARRRLEIFREVDRELLRHLKRLAISAALSGYAEQMDRVGALRGLERRGRDG